VMAATSLPATSHRRVDAALTVPAKLFWASRSIRR